MSYLDENGLLYLWQKIKTALGNKVDKVSNYGLSKNDYTDAEQSKLSGIAAGAQVNVIESISVNGTPLTVTSKGVSITVPTAVSGLSNDSGFQTSSDVQSAINSALAGITQIDFQVKQELPGTGTKGVIYLISHSHGTDDGYDEYIWVNNAFEKLGHADINLSGYLQTSAIISNNDIDAIVAT